MRSHRLPSATRTRLRRPRQSRSRLHPPLPARSLPREPHLLIAATISRGSGGGRLQEQAMAGMARQAAGASGQAAAPSACPEATCSRRRRGTHGQQEQRPANGDHRRPRRVSRGLALAFLPENTTARGTGISCCARTQRHTHTLAHSRTRTHPRLRGRRNIAQRLITHAALTAGRRAGPSSKCMFGEKIY
jgi:hypothetical protein